MTATSRRHSMQQELVERIHGYIDAHFQDHVSNVQEYLRQPSVSVTGEGILKTAQITRDLIRSIGGEAELVSTAGYPIIYGKILNPAASATLLRYDRVDVQPPEPLEEWIAPPFEG